MLEVLAATSEATTFRYLAIERNGRLVGGLPAAIRRRAGFSWIHAMPELLPGAPLAMPGEHAAVDLAAAAGLESLAAERRAVGGLWACYRADGPPVATAALERVSGETRTMESAHVRLDADGETLRRRIDRKIRSELREARARGLRAEEDERSLDEAYALYRAQARRWGVRLPVPLDRLRRLLGLGGAGGERPVRLFAVHGARGLLTATLVLDSPRETMLWWSGSHPAARAAHAFPCLLWGVVEWAHARGRARVNFGASAGLDPLLAFKGSLGAAPFAWPVRWLGARHAGIAGRVIARLQSRARRGRHRGAPA